MQNRFKMPGVIQKRVIITCLSLSSADQHIHGINFMNFKLCLLVVLPVMRQTVEIVVLAPENLSTDCY